MADNCTTKRTENLHSAIEFTMVSNVLIIQHLNYWHLDLKHIPKLAVRDMVARAKTMSVLFGSLTSWQDRDWTPAVSVSISPCAVVASRLSWMSLNPSTCRGNCPNNSFFSNLVPNSDKQCTPYVHYLKQYQKLLKIIKLKYLISIHKYAPSA